MRSRAARYLCNYTRKRLLCFVRRCVRLFAECLPRFRLACYVFSNEWARLPFVSLQTYLIPFPVWFSLLVRVVSACSPFTSTHCADAILCRCHLQGVPRLLETLHGKPHLPLLHCHRCGLLLCGLSLNPILFVCRSRGRRVLMCCADLAGIGVIRLWLFPFCNAKLQRVLYIYQTKIQFSFVFIHLSILVKVYWLNL